MPVVREEGIFASQATANGEPRMAEVNWDEALERVGGDVELLREVAKLFLDTAPQQMADLQSALTRGDPAGLQCAAHALKGAISIFGARAAFEAALRLENLARFGDMAQAEPAWAALQEAITRLKPALTARVCERQK